MTVKPNTDEAIDFLKHWEPSGSWVLTAIDPDVKGSIETATYNLSVEHACRAWIDSWQGRRNLYFSVNRPKRTLEKKAEKSDIDRALALHVDIDVKPNEDIDVEIERLAGLLAEYEKPPSIILASGGGVQGFWLLDQPTIFSTPEEIEDRNRGIERALGGDNCHNIDRIMRLPGTINLPNKLKRSKGRKKAVARIIFADWTRRYKLDDFPAVAKEKGTSIKTTFGAEPVLVEGVSEHIRHLIKIGDASEYNGDRSKAVYAVVCELARCAHSPEEIAVIISNPKNGISAHVLDQAKPRDYALRQARSGYKAAARFLEHEGRPVANNQHNIRLAMALIGVKVSHDSFANKDYIEGPGNRTKRNLDDKEMKSLYLTIDARFKFKPGVEFFWMFVEDEALRSSFHPVLDYLNGLQWDGVKRLDQWLTTYAQAVNNRYTRAVGRLMLVAAVRRVRQPGCKFDEMLILEGTQGDDKSNALRALAVEDEWFTDDLPLTSDAKVAIEQMTGKWIVEAGELVGMKKGEVEHLKAFLSRRSDRARMSYGRMAIEMLRQSVIFGTTNGKQYLRDVTGNRRFWPVAVGKFDTDAIKRDRDQLWAEASHAEASDESIRLDPSLYADAGEEQEYRREEDAWEPALTAALGNMPGKILTEDIWTSIIKLPLNLRQSVHGTRLYDVMVKMGFEKTRRRFDEGGRAEYGFERGTDKEKEQRIYIEYKDGEPRGTHNAPPKKNGYDDSFEHDSAAEAVKKGIPRHARDREGLLDG